MSSAICMIAGKEMSAPQAIRETRMGKRKEGTLLGVSRGMKKVAAQKVE